MTSEENEKRDCREARFSFEGRKPCPNLGNSESLSQQYRARAEQCCAKAQTFRDPKARARMLDVAATGI